MQETLVTSLRKRFPTNAVVKRFQTKLKHLSSKFFRKFSLDSSWALFLIKYIFLKKSIETN